MKQARTLRHVILAGRFYFLPGGMLVYTLGATVAWYERAQLALTPLLLGLAVVVLVQVMTNYVNESWDSSGDALVTRRMLFSGGSGMLQGGLITTRMLYMVAMACGMAGVLLTVVLGFTGHLSWFSLLLITLAVLGGIAYSQPPPRLVARGLGEMMAALIISLLTPLLGYSLQTDGVSLLLIFTCLPAVAMIMAMLLAVELPDYGGDVETGKRNLVVRLGLERSALLYDAMLAAGFLLAVLGVLGGAPFWAGLLPVAVLPVALVQAWVVRRVTVGDTAKSAWMTFLGIAIFVLFCALQVTGYVMGHLISAH